MFWKAWFDNNIVTVKNILNDNGTIMTLTNDFTEKYGNVKSNFPSVPSDDISNSKTPVYYRQNINIDNGIYDNGKPVAQGQK